MRLSRDREIERDPSWDKSESEGEVRPIKTLEHSHGLTRDSLSDPMRVNLPEAAFPTLCEKPPKTAFPIWCTCI